MKITLLAIVGFVFVWSAIHPHDYFTWVLEVIPVMLAVPLLLATHKKFPLTPIAYFLIALHACILMVGGHYTYALAPLGEWLETSLELARNPYDRFGHFAQGFIPAVVIREVLLRTSPLRAGKWLCAIIVFSCLGISAGYEILEWLAAITTGEAAEAFLGTQGDVWDTQNDMALAGLGAITALLALSHWHDKQLAKIT